MTEVVLSWGSGATLVLLFVVVGVRTWRVEHEPSSRPPLVRNLDWLGLLVATVLVALLVARVLAGLGG